MEEWRTVLYPLGFLSAIAFGARFLIQWFESERKHETVVPRSFWILSLIGNLLLVLHSLIQVQYPICLVQACNAVISWRNLNLMQAVNKRISFKTVLLLILLSAVLTTGAFFIQDHFIIKTSTWFRTPIAPWQSPHSIDTPLFWHLLGTAAYLIFSSRFWLQWFISEKAQKSELPLSFWWLSLIGALFSIVYFIHLRDLVNLVGPLVGLVPYIRNLMIMTPKKI